MYDSRQELQWRSKLLDGMKIHYAFEGETIRENETREFFWVNQCHGSRVIKVDAHSDQISLRAEKADALWTTEKHTTCAVWTADCIPLLLVDKQRRYVAAVHAGWRGVQQGIGAMAMKSICDDMQCKASDIVAVIGPSIGMDAFEMDEDVFESLKKSMEMYGGLDASHWYRRENKWHMDLKAMQAQQLQKMGVLEIEISPVCTTQSTYYASHRQSKGTCGRNVSWISL